jgi:hypothetical protein
MVPSAVAITVEITPMETEVPNASQTPWASQTLVQLSNVNPRQAMLLRR